MAEYVKFDDAVQELKMSAEELKALMDEGKIRHFMDGGAIKFRRQDIDTLKESLGIAAPQGEDDLTLAPPDDLPDVPRVEEDVPPPPPPAEEDFSIAPLDEEEASEGAPPQAAAPGEEAEDEGEEIASLSEFEIGEDIEEEGEELSDEEAQLLSVETPGFRSLEEPQTASVGMTVLLVITTVLLAFGIVTLLSFVTGINPLKSLTDMFV